MTVPRVMIIGLDGATFDLIEPWMAEGKLPGFKQLVETSSHGRLLSTIPPISPPAWASFMTGVNPGKHGIYDFIAFKDHSPEKLLLNSTHIRSKTFWNLAGERGKKSIILHLPLTYPPQPLNGVMITGLPHPDDAPGVFPPEMAAELDEKVGPWRFSLRGRHFREVDPGLFADRIREIVETRRKAARYLLDKDWDVFLLTLTETDVVQHLFWEEKERCVLPIYQMADRMVTELLAIPKPEDFVMVLSDHGFGPIRNTFYLNEWLREKGFLSTRRLTGRDAEAAGPGSAPAGSRQNPLRRLFRRLRGQKSREIRWEKTRAYFFNTGQQHGIGINLEGREPFGIVPPGEYESVRRQVMDALAGLKEPRNGKVVVERVFRREEVYSGPWAQDAPDIVFVPNYEYMVSERTHLRLFRDREPGRGGHRPEGIFFLKGPGIREGNPLAGPSIVDVAPTILHLLGLPVPKGMDGKVLSEAFRPEVLQNRPIEYEELPLGVEMEGYRMTEAEEEDVKMRLRGLGYIE